MKKRVFIRTFSVLLAFMTLLTQLTVPASAWLQPAHMQINEAAIKNFQQTYANSTKYNNAEVDLSLNCRAPIVTTTGKFSTTYYQQWQYLTADEQIIEGGFSADEPNVYVSMKHFYDPLALSGKNELTDQENGWGFAYTPIPATEWALWNEENPYSLHNAMLYYKKSMEIPSDAQPAAIPTIGNFRDYAGTPANLVEMRDMYLGKAMRGLGETMHLVADMTQPAHVRNDSHPLWEITETAISEGVAADILRAPNRLDSVAIGMPNHVFELMTNLATYTNSHFYSADTIADTAAGVTPKNWEKPYSMPNFSQFTTKKLQGYDTYYATFGGEEIPMVSKIPGWVYGYSYQITDACAIQQARVLLPLAAASDAQVLNMFFPTFVMEQQVQEVEVDADMLDAAKAQGAQELKQYEAAIKLTHEVAKDPLWTGEGLSIAYSGPGQLWRIRGSKTIKLSDVEFINGVLVKYQEPETGELTEGNPVFYLPSGGEKQMSLTGPAVDYTVEYGDAIYVSVDAGARAITSKAYVFEQEEPEITLTASTDTVLPGEKVTFTAEIANPPERYKLEWTFGDEDAEAGEQSIVNRKTTMTHLYEKGGDYTVTVRLIDTKRNVERCSDSVTVTSELTELEGNWNITLKVEQESKLFRSFVIGVMKVIIRYLISPLSEALGGGPVDESAAESFTLVGSEIYYTATLLQSETDPGSYSGALVYAGSNTDYIEGPEDYVSLRMVIDNGYINFYAQGYDAYGNAQEVPFLMKGMMSTPGYIQGDYDFGGSISGTWTASKG